MATENPGQAVSLPAAGDLSAGQYRGVEVNSAGRVAISNALGEYCDGVLQNKPAALGRAATVQTSGITKVVAGTGGLALGDLVTVAADGSFVTAAKATTVTNDAGAAADALVGSCIFGRCVKAAAAAGIASVLISQAGAVPTTAA